MARDEVVNTLAYILSGELKGMFNDYWTKFFDECSHYELILAWEQRHNV
jgi:hypothetical protein